MPGALFESNIAKYLFSLFVGFYSPNPGWFAMNRPGFFALTEKFPIFQGKLSIFQGKLLNFAASMMIQTSFALKLAMRPAVKLWVHGFFVPDARTRNETGQHDSFTLPGSG